MVFGACHVFKHDHVQAIKYAEDNNHLTPSVYTASFCKKFMQELRNCDKVLAR